MAKIVRNPQSSSLEEARLLWGRANEEWKVVQQKIDSVSNFPFTIKAWSITVVGVLVGLAKGFEINVPGPLLYTFAIFGPLTFYLLETRHNRVRDILARRATVLEQLMDETDAFEHYLPDSCPPRLVEEIGRIPGTAFTIRDATRRLQARISPQLSGIWTAHQRTQRPRGAAIGRIGRQIGQTVGLFWIRLVPHSDNIFYFGQIILMCLVIFFVSKQTEPNVYRIQLLETSASASTKITGSVSGPESKTSPGSTDNPNREVGTPHAGRLQDSEVAPNKPASRTEASNLGASSTGASTTGKPNAVASNPGEANTGTSGADTSNSGTSTSGASSESQQHTSSTPALAPTDDQKSSQGAKKGVSGS